MKPFLHSKGSVSRWGGIPSDYDHIHDFIDSTKVAMPDLRHRAVLHNAFGCFLVEKVFGRTIINSDGREVSTRDIAENHIQEDMGFIPSLEDWLDTMPIEKWHGGIHRLKKEERPPTPAEERQAISMRVCQILDEAGLPSYDIPNVTVFVNKLIAAVRGTEKETD